MTFHDTLLRREVPALERGTALVFAGPQGSGKTLLAKKAAATYGRIQVSPPDRLCSAFALSDEPGVLVLEGLPKTLRQSEVVEDLLDAETFPTERQGVGPVWVKSPYVIICTDEKVPSEIRQSRRFRVVDLPAPEAAW